MVCYADGKPHKSTTVSFSTVLAHFFAHSRTRLVTMLGGGKIYTFDVDMTHQEMCAIEYLSVIDSIELEVLEPAHAQLVLDSVRIAD